MDFICGAAIALSTVVAWFFGFAGWILVVMNLAIGMTGFLEGGFGLTRMAVGYFIAAGTCAVIISLLTPDDATDEKTSKEK